MCTLAPGGLPFPEPSRRRAVDLRARCRSKLPCSAARRRGTRRIALWLALVLAASAASAQTADHPNILFVAIDDLNDWVGALGGFDGVLLDPALRLAATPNLDRMAQLGTSFVNAQTAAPACNPSRAALMSGIAPGTSGLTKNQNGIYFRNFDALRFATSLPQQLKRPAAGATLYTIFTTGKVWHSGRTDLPGSGGPSPRAATEWDEASYKPDAPLPAGIAIDGATGLYNPWNLAGLEWTQQIPLYHGKRVRDPALLAAFSDAQADQQKALWGAEHVREDPPGGDPVFLAVGIFRPHLPWRVPVQFFERFPLAGIHLPKVLPHDLSDVLARDHTGLAAQHPLILEHSTDPAFPGERDIAWRLAIQAYLASSAYADEAFGKMLDAVIAKNSDQDPDNDWTVVVWSDHGYHLGEKERWQKFTLWEESARSVLMVWQPGLTGPGSTVEAPVDFLDIFPTMLDLAGVAPIPQLQGTSFLDLLGDPTARSDNVAFTTLGEGRHSIRSLRWRYIRHPDNFEELYDHFHDPDEFYNLLHPQNQDRLEEFGINASFLGTVHLALATALFEWSLKIHNQAIHDGTIQLEKIPTLGRRAIERFDGTGELTDRGWTVRRSSGPEVGADFLLEGGRAHAPANAVRATENALRLRRDEDFLASVAVELAPNTPGLGLLFGYVGEGSFFELELIDESSPEGEGGVDLLLRRREQGVDTVLRRVDAIRRLDAPSGPALDFTDGPYTLLVGYTAAAATLELIVQDGLGVNQYRETVQLEQPLAPSSAFGIASHAPAALSGAALQSSFGTFDDFVTIAHLPQPTLGETLSLVESQVQVDEGAGVATFSVHRGGPPAGEVSVDYYLVGGSAWIGKDVVATSGTLHWADGDAADKIFTVDVLDDADLEGDESVSVVLHHATGPAAVGVPARAELTIADDDQPGICEPVATRLCLEQERFALELEWRTAEGELGTCHAVPLTGASGYCWFFAPDNVEVIAKVVDACAPPFERFWVFAAGLTNVEVRITVLDTQTGERRVYTRPQGQSFLPIQDVSAFATCP